MTTGKLGPESLSSRIFIVEDDAPNARELVDLLTGLGYTIVGRAARGEEALDQIPASLPDLVLIDLGLTGRLTGIETADRVHEILNVPVIFLGSPSHRNSIEDAVGHDPLGYLVRPFNQRELHATLQAALFRHQVELLRCGAPAQVEAVEQYRSAEREGPAREKVDATSDLILGTDVDGRILFANRAWRERLGYSEEEVAAMNLIDAVHPDSREACHTLFRRIGRGADLGVMDLAFRAKNGRSVLVEGRVKVRSRTGKPLVARGIFRDVTSRRAAEEARHRDLRFRTTLTNCIPGLVAHWTGDLRCNYSNQEFFHWFGRNPEQMRGARLQDVLGEKQFKLNEPFIRAVLRGEPQHFEWAITKPDGTVGDTWAHYIPDQAGELVVGFFVLVSDITPIKQAERALRAAQQALGENERLLTSINQNLVGSFVYRVEISSAGRMTCSYISPNVDEVTGLPPKEFLDDAERFYALLLTEDVVRMKECLVVHHPPGAMLELDVRLMHARDRSLHWLRLRGRCVDRGDDGTAVVEGIAIDITVAKEAEAAEQLRASEQRYAQLLENVHDAIIRDDVAGHIVFANRWFLDWFGLANRNLREVSIEDYVAPEWQAVLRDRHDRQVRGEKMPDRFEFEGLRADGRRIWLDVFATPVVESGCIVGTQSVLRDITLRKQAEQGTQAVLSRTATVVGQEFYRVLAYELGRAFDLSVICIARSTAPGRLVPLAHYSDGQMLELREFELPPGHPSQQVLSRGETVLIERGLGESAPVDVCGRHDLVSYCGLPLRSGDRSIEGLLFVANTQPLRLEALQLSLLNILALQTEAEFARERIENERAEMQVRLLQSQKYEALGTLAGGVAHDFNNILTGVINYTELALEDCPSSHPQIKEFLSEVLYCGNRAKELVRQILLFSRSEDDERVPLVLQQVVGEALSLLRSTLPATIEVRPDLEEDAPVVLANATQIHQVVMNLGINAAHAMQERGGILTVKLRQRMIDLAHATKLSDLKPGPHLCLEVTDTGCGMTPAVATRIFEPFFTTKKRGEGTGLGLAMVHSVVRNHQGAISVRSWPGVGTTFEILLPVHAQSSAASSDEPGELPRGRGQRILLVDDEVTVARSVQLMLERLDYQVTMFTKPEQALAHFMASPGDFDVVLTDFQMPGMTGIGLAKKILAQRPGLPVLVASGFAGDETGGKMLADGIAGFLHKPIDLLELAETLERTLRP